MTTRASGRRPRRPEPPEDVQFPVTPMLDMAFQLLAFFVLTFQAPSAETHIDLDLPTTPLALPGAARGKAEAAPARRVDTDLENDLVVRARANELGDLISLQLGESSLPDEQALGARLRQYVGVLEGKPLRVRLVADDGLRYELAVRLVATCAASGVSSVRLTDPALQPQATPPAPGGTP